MNIDPATASLNVRRCGIALIGMFCGLATAALLIAPHAFPN